ncbi:gfo/Idh/MocA family oxidoreductase [Candidatus Woesearchaeota archaeon]|nr:gfo/Idh/MocA family oxidoreductase [Candidatus Woesearchaeota archaeon]
MLKAAVIGTGLMGSNHVRVLSETENVELVAIAESNNSILTKISKKYGCKPYSDYRKMIKNEKIDLICIAVPTSLHREVSLFAIKNKINVLIEKPIAATLEEGREIIDQAHKQGVKLMVGHIERFNPGIIELKKRLKNGELGRIFKVDVHRIGPFPTRVKDIGVVIDLAVHDLDIIRYLSDSEVKRIYAETEKKIHTGHEDLLTALLKLQNGAICNLNINWLTPTKIRKLYLTGERGMFEINYLTQDLYFYENAEVKKDIGYFDVMMGVSEGKMVRFKIDRKEPLKAEIEHFIDCIENKSEPLVKGEDGLKAIELAHAIIRSSNENSVI